MARVFSDTSPMVLNGGSKPILAKRLAELLASRPEKSRLDHSRAMGVADGTLGRIKYGTGNPTIEVIDQIASYFRIQPWQLLQPEGELREPVEPSQPVSGEALMIAADVADEALQGLWLPKNRYFELVSLALEGISQGLPYAEILEFIAPAARKLAKSEVISDDSEQGLDAPGARGHGRRAATGNR